MIRLENPMRPSYRLRLASLTLILVGLSLTVAGLVLGPHYLHRRELALREAARHEKDAERWQRLIDATEARRAEVKVTKSRIAPSSRSRLWDEGYDVSEPFFFEWTLEGYPPGTKTWTDLNFADLINICRERVAYHERMNQKWRSYASMPWVEFVADGRRPPVSEPAMPLNESY
jgi:hypothetical protein